MIQPDGTLVVRAPHFVKDSAIRDLIQKKRDWIEKTSRRVRERGAFVPKRFTEGESFTYLGKEYPLHITDDMYGKLIFEDRFILAAKYHPKAKRLFEKWYKEEAFSVLSRQCRAYAERMGVKYKSLSLSGAKKRWGSCSAKGTLRFNWRLVMAPLEILDYVVVHELAHLRELNHSKKYWAVVENVYPAFRTARQWLKHHGARLDWH